MTKSLPLCIDWVHWSAWEMTLSNKLSPVDLVLILLTRKVSDYLEYLNEFSNSKSSSLTSSLFRVCRSHCKLLLIWHLFLLHYKVIRVQYFLGLDWVINPTVIIDCTWLVVVYILLIKMSITNLISKTFNYISHHASIISYQIFLFLTTFREKEY
jgi:hypothetical protein